LAIICEIIFEVSFFVELFRQPAGYELKNSLVFHVNLINCLFFLDFAITLIANVSNLTWNLDFRGSLCTIRLNDFGVQSLLVWLSLSVVLIDESNQVLVHVDGERDLITFLNLK